MEFGKQEVFAVSKQAPFLSNLNVLSNITLVKESTQYFFENSANEEAMQKLHALGLHDKAYMHHTTLSQKELFLVQMVRASMLEQKDIVIDRPFEFLAYEYDTALIQYALKSLNIDTTRVKILDIKAMQSRYKEDVCRIKEWL